MPENQQNAFITGNLHRHNDLYILTPLGGSSGIGLALSKHLLGQGYHIFIADRNISGAKALAEHFNDHKVQYIECDVSSWHSQLSAFQSAVKLFDRIDFVAPIAGIGERKWIPSLTELQNMKDGEFQEPDLSVIEVDLKGVMYTVGLAVQQFRRQEKNAQGFRGRIGVVASVCGFYCISTLPIYTAAKHGVVGLVRTYGKLLPEEAITLNAVCPNIVETGISTSEFYDEVRREGLLVEMKGVIDAFKDLLGGVASGEVYEVGPKGGWVKREGQEYLDEESKKSCELLVKRGRPLH
jgi:NAD(P)-dependent dehydrogenase (short-subunit alcohol dehydrogenase family)